MLANRQFFTSGRWGVASGSFGGVVAAGAATASPVVAGGIIRPSSATRPTGDRK
jgi:hypothetical protein